MRRIALRIGVGIVAAGLAAGCKATKVDPLKYASIEVDKQGEAPVGPPKPGDVTRTFATDRGRVAKAFFRNLSANVADGDFAMDLDGGKWFFQKKGSVEDHVRQLRGKGPGGHWMLVELRSDGAYTTAIVRGSTPKFEEAAALALLDKVDAELKAQAPADAPKTKS